MRRALIIVSVVVVVAVGGALVGHARGGDEPAMVAPAAGAPPAVAPSSPRPGSTAVAAAVDPGTTPAPTVEDVTAARDAGVAAVARTREVFEAGGISRRDVVAEFATAEFAPMLAERTSQQIIDVLFGLREASGRQVDVKLVAQPVTATATPVGAGRVSVDVWTVTVILAEGDSPVPEQWSTIRLDMVLTDGRWLVDGWAMTAGPAPAPAPESAFGSAGEVSAAMDWPSVGARLMLPIIPGLPNPISIFTGFVSSAVGWAWDKVVQGIFTWFAEGLLLLIEWVWSLLDTATTPRLTDAWFVNGVVAALVPIALFVTVAMMLMTGTQAALSGRPELIVDAVASTVRAIAGMAFTLVVVDTLVRFADVIADTVWVQARPNTREVLDGIINGVLNGARLGGDVPRSARPADRHGGDDRDGAVAVHALRVAVLRRRLRLVDVVVVDLADDARQRPPHGPHRDRVDLGQAGDRDQPGHRHAADRGVPAGR